MKDDKDNKKVNNAARKNTQSEPPKKVGWFKKLLFAQSYDDDKELDKQQQARVDQTIKVNQQLKEVFGQLDKKVEQNNTVLLQTLESLKKNNESLLKQVQVLSESNKQLYEKMLVSNKRARVLKIFALLASLFTITLGAYNLYKLIFGG